MNENEDPKNEGWRLETLNMKTKTPEHENNVSDIWKWARENELDLGNILQSINLLMSKCHFDFYHFSR